MVKQIASTMLMAFAARAVLGQSAPSFEVASIRLNMSSQGRTSMDFPPGGERFTATHVSLGALVLTAYSITPQQCSCQSSALPVLSERFDIQAKAEHASRRGEMLGMLRTLLKERFKLQIQRETKEFEAYGLVVQKGGPRLHLTDVPRGGDATPLNPYHARGLEPGGGYLVFEDETMEDFAWRLSTLVILGGRVVVDKTGLKEHYDFELKFRPEPESAPRSRCRCPVDIDGD